MLLLDWETVYESSPRNRPVKPKSAQHSFLVNRLGTFEKPTQTAKTIQINSIKLNFKKYIFILNNLKKIK